MMSEQTTKLIELINEGKTCNEICHILNISNKQLFNNLTILQNKGFHYKRKYYSNGAIVYKPIKSNAGLGEFYSKKDISIITSHNEVEINTLEISDLHCGNELERLDLLDRVYNYCIKNNIHIIFLCGDIIDGTYTKGNQNIKDTYYQIEHVIKKFPFDKNILVISIAGDHDSSSLYNNCQDIITMLKNYRHDIILGNYSNMFVHLKNDTIHLFHKINGSIFMEEDVAIVYHGHYHKYSVNQKSDGTLHITVPSLSNINQPMPTAIQSTLKFNKGYINEVYLNQIYFGDDDYILNEIKFNISKRNNIPSSSILNEEKEREEIFDDYTKESTVDDSKTLVKKTQRLSQIEKFNKKYGL